MTPWREGLLFVALAGFLLTTAPLRAENRLLSAGMEVDVTAGGPVPVVLRYELEAEPGERQVPLRAVAPPPARIAGLTASSGSRGLAVEVDPSGSPVVLATIALPEELARRGSFPLELRYAVEEARVDEGEGAAAVRLPLAAVTWPPAGARAGLFAAEVRLPAGSSVSETFPALAVSESGAAEEDVLRLDLPVLPALVRFRLHDGGSPGFTLPRLLDAAMAVLLLGFAWAGWRMLGKGG